MDFEDDYYDKDPYTDDDSDKLDSDEEERIRSYYSYNIFKPIQKPIEEPEISLKDDFKTNEITSDEEDSKYTIKEPLKNEVIDLTNLVEQEGSVEGSESSIEDGEIITISSSPGEEVVPTKSVFEVQDISKSTYQVTDFLTHTAKEIPRYFNSVTSSLKCHKCAGDHLMKNCPHKDDCMICGKENHKSGRCPLTMMCFKCKKLGHSKDECTEKFAVAGCNQCGSTIHSSENCTDFWRIYSIERHKKTVHKPKSSCSNCGFFGHYSDDCPNKRNQNESAFKNLETILYQQNIKGVNIEGNVAATTRPKHFYFIKVFNGGKKLSYTRVDPTNSNRGNRRANRQPIYQSNNYYNANTRDDFNSYNNFIYSASYSNQGRYGKNNSYNQSISHSSKRNNYNSNNYTPYPSKSKNTNYGKRRPYPGGYNGNS